MKITTATPEQWAAIEQLKNEWIANTTKQYTHEEVSAVVERMYKRIDGFWDEAAQCGMNPFWGM